MKTPATEFLRERGVAYTEHHYDYVEHGGAERGAQELGVPSAQVVKTLVMQDEQARPLIVLDEFGAAWVKVSIAKLGILKDVGLVGVSVERKA